MNKNQLIEEAVKDLLERGMCLAERDEDTNRLHAHPATAQVLKNVLTTLLTKHEDAVVEIDENTSDGYHTFKELYEFRLLYNAHLFNEWAAQGKYDVHKSTKHSDGEDCFGGGWFIVVATLPAGYISNHYEMKDWDLFQCEVKERAKEWDGHTSQDVVARLRKALSTTDHIKNSKSE